MTGLKFLIKSLWVLALFQLVKGDFQQGNVVYILRIMLWKKMAFYLQKVVNFA